MKDRDATPSAQPAANEASGEHALFDGQGRRLEYLRLSVTGRCNYRCVYCLPEGCQRERERPLTVDEIEHLVRAFAALGFWKVRVSGGEPTTRADLCELVGRIAATPGVRRIGLTTNGDRLAALAPGLRRAGLDALNVSLDSLERERFAHITGRDRLAGVLKGIEAALAAGIPSLKINAVLLRGFEDAELERFLAWTRELPITVRFIELMQTGDNVELFRRAHLPAEDVRARLLARGWAPLERSPSDGPAALYGHPSHAGKVGLIAPYGDGFCRTCNRLRVSSTGDLRLCLFGEEQIPLRAWLQRADQQPELERLLQAAVRRKPAGHALKEGRCGATRNLAAIGG